MIEDASPDQRLEFFEYCLEQISSGVTCNPSADERRCIAFLKTFWKHRDKVEEALADDRFRQLLQRAAQMDKLLEHLLPFMCLNGANPENAQNALLKPFLGKKDELESLTDDIQYWYESQVMKKRLCVVSSGHPYERPMNETVFIPQATGLAVIFASASGTLNNQSSLTIEPTAVKDGAVAFFAPPKAPLLGTPYSTSYPPLPPLPAPAVPAALGAPTFVPSPTAPGPPGQSRPSRPPKASKDARTFAGSPGSDAWTACDFPGANVLDFSFRTDAAGSAKERRGFSAAVVPLEEIQDAERKALSQELSSNMAMIMEMLKTLEDNRKKQAMLLDVLLSFMKTCAAFGENQRAAEFLHVVLRALARSPWMRLGSMERVLGLPFQSLVALVQKAGQDGQDSEQKVFQAWLEEIQATVAAYIRRQESEDYWAKTDAFYQSTDEYAMSLALPILAEAGPCLEAVRLQLLQAYCASLTKLQQQLMTDMEKQALIQACMRYHACKELSLLVESKALPLGVQLLQSCHPYDVRAHGFEAKVHVEGASELAVAFASLGSCDMGRALPGAAISVQGPQGTVQGTIQGVQGDGRDMQRVPGADATVSFTTAPQSFYVGASLPTDQNARWGFLALIGDSGKVSFDKLAEEARKIANSPVMDMLFKEALEA